MNRARTFTVVLEPEEEEEGFTVRVPSLPEIVTYGSDEREALDMAQDAIRLVLEDRAARGEPLLRGEFEARHSALIAQAGLTVAEFPEFPLVHDGFTLISSWPGIAGRRTASLRSPMSRPSR